MVPAVNYQNFLLPKLKTGILREAACRANLCVYHSRYYENWFSGINGNVPAKREYYAELLTLIIENQYTKKKPLIGENFLFFPK